MIGDTNADFGAGNRRRGGFHLHRRQPEERPHADVSVENVIPRLSRPTGRARRHETGLSPILHRHVFWLGSGWLFHRLAEQNIARRADLFIKLSIFGRFRFEAAHHHFALGDTEEF